MSPRFGFALGCTLAGLAVATGAFGAHALSDLPPERLATWRTAALYHLVHAVAIVAATSSSHWSKSMARGTWLLTAGVVLFSGSLYALVLGGPRWLGPVTPIGGLSFILGWMALAIGRLRT